MFGACGMARDENGSPAKQVRIGCGRLCTIWEDSGKNDQKGLEDRGSIPREKADSGRKRKSFRKRARRNDYGFKLRLVSKSGFARHQGILRMRLAKDGSSAEIVVHELETVVHLCFRNGNCTLFNSNSACLCRDRR